MLVAVTEDAVTGAALPKVTDAGAVNPVPVMTTLVLMGPEVGEKPDNVGAAFGASAGAAAGTAAEITGADVPAAAGP